MTTPKSEGFKPRIFVSQRDDVFINLNEKIGKWTYGDYFKGSSKSLGRELMVKIIDLNKFPLKKKCLETEINILKKLKSTPYIVEFMEYKYYEKTLVIVTELSNGGDLRSYLQKNGPLPEQEAIRLLMQLVCGLKALQQIGYTHGAVRPENILIHESNGKITLKLSNFIFARSHKGDNSASFPVPIDSPYLAPEVLKDNKYDPKSDIWSLGVIYYEMIYGALPWDGKTIEELRDNIINKRLEIQGGEGFSDTSIDFIFRCLNRDLKKRIDWKEITDHRLIFRALFMNDDGSYKVYNDEFKESSPSRRLLMYGSRMSSANNSIPGSPSKNNTSYNKSTSGKLITSQNSASNSPFNLKTTSPFKIREEGSPDSEFAKDPNYSPFRTYVTDSPERNSIKATTTEDGKTDLKESPEVASFEARMDEAQHDLSKGIEVAEGDPKKLNPDFYTNLLAKVGETDDYYLAKFMNRDSIDTNGPFSKKTFVKPFKWLANKAEVLGEIYELALRNRQHCCYDRIIQLFNEETSNWNTLGLVANFQKKFVETVESSAKKEEEEKNSFWPKQVKANHSLAKKEKSQQIASLIEEIVASLTNNIENVKGNNEELLQIAANFKILREFDEIGDSVIKELDVMKNSLIVFYRKKDHSHIRYILTVRNLA